MVIKFLGNIKAPQKIVRIYFIIISVFLVSCSTYQKVYDQNVVNKFQGFENYKYTDPKPLSNLPQEIIAPDSQLTLYADYNSIYNNSILIYVINRTGEKITFPTEGSLYTMQEILSDDGRWERAEPHYYSGCGNSYSSITLKNNEYLICKGYYPEEGEESIIRYRFYNRENTNTFSNEGYGFYNEDNYERAKWDKMAIFNGDYDFLSKIALNEITIPDGEICKEGNIRRTAISCLTKFNDEKTFNLISYLLFDDQNTNELDKKFLIRTFPHWKDERKISLLSRLISDSTISSEFFRDRLWALCYCSRQEGKKYIQQHISDKASPFRSILLNQLTVEITNDFGDYNRKKLWESDSLNIIAQSDSFALRYLKREVDTDPKQFDSYRNPPGADRLWYSDTVLFNYLNSVKYDYSDPSYKGIISAYGAYRNEYSKEFFKNLLKNTSLPKSILERAQQQYEFYFRNMIFAISCEIDQNKYRNSDFLNLPVKIRVRNLSNNDINISLEEIYKGLKAEIIIRGDQDSIKFNTDDFIQNKFDLQDSTSNFLIQKSRSIFTTFNLPVKKEFIDNVKYPLKRIGLEIKMELLIEKLTDIPARTDQRTSL